MADMLSDCDHLLNPELIRMTARSIHGGRPPAPPVSPFHKVGFVPGSDPNMTGAGGGDPAAGGGDPAAGGGAPPPDPAAGGGGGGGGADMSALQPMIMQMVQQAMQQSGGAGGMAGGAGGAAGGAGALKPKIDQNAVSLQILKILARIADALKIPIPASEMVVNQSDLMGLANATSTGGPMPGMDPTAGAGAPAGGAQGPQGGMPPMPGAEAGMAGAPKAAFDFAERQGCAFNSNGLVDTGNRAMAIRKVLYQNRRAS